MLITTCFPTSTLGNPHIVGENSLTAEKSNPPNPSYNLFISLHAPHGVLRGRGSFTMDPSFSKRGWGDLQPFMQYAGQLALCFSRIFARVWVVEWPSTMGISSTLAP